MRIIQIIILLSILIFANNDRPPIKHNFLKSKSTQKFISKMVKKYHFKRNYLVKVLSDAKLDRDTLSRYKG